MQKTSNLNNTEPDSCVWATELAVFTVFAHNELAQKANVTCLCGKGLSIFENMIKDKKNLAAKMIFYLSLLCLPIHLSNVQL